MTASAIRARHQVSTADTTAVRICWVTSESALWLCLFWCDPLAQDCPDDYLCVGSQGAFMCVIDASGEEGQYSDPCEWTDACDPGLVCLNPEYVPGCQAGGCCSPFCDTSKANTCPGDGQECIAWFEEGMAPPGFEDVGVCGVPQ